MRTDAGTRIAVVGYGYWGAKHVRVLTSLTDVGVVVVDSRPQRTAEARRRFPGVETAARLTDVVDQVDGVVVASPPATHATLALEALNAGRPTLVEKPLATSVREAQTMVDTAALRGVPLMVGHTFEYHPAVHRLKEIISSGELGQILHIESARLNLGLYRSDVDVVWDLAPHDISIISYLLDEIPSSVASWAHRKIKDQHADIAYLRLVLEQTAATAFIHVSWLHPTKVRRLTVVGDRRMAVYDDTSDEQRIRIHDVRVESAGGDAPVIYRVGDIVVPRVEFQEPLLVQDAHFVECVRGGAQPRTPGERGLDVVRVLAAADVARVTGQWASVHGDIPRARVSPESVVNTPVFAPALINDEVRS